tara:strand:- start:181 stop:639 length:459 start_codon:yes stop_codon:yes gene_type:complete
MSRDYKDEYQKFQSSDKKKKYRAKLNKYNRDKGTYGNGDGKDASHKNGKITGFVDSSTNKGKKEASRLKGSKRKAEHGGKMIGPSHDNGGIDINVEGGEVVINKSVNNAAGKHEKDLLKLNKNPNDYKIVKKNEFKCGGHVYPTSDAKNRRQ